MADSSPPLAFVFWHRPMAGVAPEAYERGLAAFHRSLAEGRPEGFLGSRSYRISRPPFDNGGPWPVAYVDWYLLEDWSALGRLNHRAIRPPHQPSHDAVAAQSAHGQGSIYHLAEGRPSLDSDRFERWLAKPPGRATEEFARELRGDGAGAVGSVWQRQLALGPAPEFCLRSPHRVPGPSEGVVEVRPVVLPVPAPGAP